MGKHYSNRPCFKEKNYKAKFLTSSIIKKNEIDKDNFKKQKQKKKIILAKKQKKNRKKRKIHVGNGKKMKKMKKNRESYNTFPTRFRVLVNRRLFFYQLLFLANMSLMLINLPTNDSARHYNQ